MEFIDRLIIEREELEKKYYKLKKYLFDNMNNIDTSSDNTDFDLLKNQYEIMGDYLTILNIRIRRVIEKFGQQTDLILDENKWDSQWIDLIDICILNKINYISCSNFKIYQIANNVNRDIIYEINDTNVIPFYKNDITDINKEKSLKIIKNTQNTGFVNESKC